MNRRFAEVKFNLMRAIELFGDMNHADMEVTAPPSDETFFKEYEVANKLNDYLTQMIEEGFFDDCDPRDPEGESDEGGSYSYGSQESAGFDYNEPESERASKESLTGRFRRYVRRMLPGGSRRHGHDEPDTGHTDTEPEDEEEDYDYDENGSSALTRRSGLTTPADSQRSVSGSRRSAASRPSTASSGSRRLSRSKTRRFNENADRELSASDRHLSGSRRERSGSEPYDPNVVYEHKHHHKHNHPNSHHHHQHPASHSHTFHTHVDDDGQASDENSSVGGISDVFGASNNESQDESDLSSTALPQSRRSSRARSGSSSRRGRSAGRRSQQRGRSSSRGSRK